MSTFKSRYTNADGKIEVVELPEDRSIYMHAFVMALIVVFGLSVPFILYGAIANF